MLGLIGKKIGMTQVFDSNGVVTPVTVVKIEDNYVIGKRSIEKNGYESCVIGAGLKKSNRVSKPYAGQFPQDVNPTSVLMEVRDFDLDCQVGDKLGVEVFEGISFVDIKGKTKGKGFQGVMKRHGFGGGRATHGSKFHRGLGGTAMATTPGKTYKGRKMPGRMGGVESTVQNLKVVKVDTEKGVILVKGAVPGPNSGMVFVREAIKK
ncbi:MAG: 50S ribosomal protein L3 [Spirochaetales bacterium]|nr:50S ribosomal protein L3 [Spirochaetales bacterium]